MNADMETLGHWEVQVDDEDPFTQPQISVPSGQTPGKCNLIYEALLDDALPKQFTS